MGWILCSSGVGKLSCLKVFNTRLSRIPPIRRPLSHNNSEYFFHKALQLITAHTSSSVPFSCNDTLLISSCGSISKFFWRESAQWHPNRKQETTSITKWALSPKAPKLGRATHWFLEAPKLGRATHWFLEVPVVRISWIRVLPLLLLSAPWST